ncbi:hypothetical protein RB195_007817 [Necator americanus]|uniref:Uncharacterized protein n=1 Tax=Necator americanus TaxID=51031 RepID=A0ABR1C1G0_NECAM
MQNTRLQNAALYCATYCNAPPLAPPPPCDSSKINSDCPDRHLVTPINYNLASLNFFIFSSSLVQLSRIAYNRYMNSNKKKTKL